MNELLTLEEVAALVHIKPRTVVSRVRRRLLPAPVKGTNPMLFARDKIMKAVAKNHNETGASYTLAYLRRDRANPAERVVGEGTLGEQSG